MNQPRTDLSPRGMLPYDAQRHCAEAAQMLPYEPLDWLRFVACSVVAFMVLALAFVLTGVSGQSVRRGVAFLLLALGIGCQSPEVIELDARFMPLQRLRQAQVPGLGEGMVATIYTEVLTRDLGALLDAYPQGSVELEALLLHEREHSFREFANPSSSASTPRPRRSGGARRRSAGGRRSKSFARTGRRSTRSGSRRPSPAQRTAA